MNKTTKIVIAVATILVVAILIVVLVKNAKTNSLTLNINNAQDLSSLVDKIYKGVKTEMPSVQTEKIDVTDADMVKAFTGLDNVNDIDALVVSEPLMSSQAYSLVLVKVKEGVNANSLAKTMNENINIRKWICVSAEKVYTTTSGNIICLVMSNADIAKDVYDSFKALAGSVGQEYERTEEEVELPPEMIVY